MRKLIDLMEDTVALMHDMDRVEAFVAGLSASDTGEHTFGNLTVHYKGFNDADWQAFEDQLARGELKTVIDLENQILRQWGNEEIIEHGWTDGCEPFCPTVFYSVTSE